MRGALHIFCRRFVSETGKKNLLDGESLFDPEIHNEENCENRSENTDNFGLRNPVMQNFFSAERAISIIVLRVSTAPTGVSGRLLV